MKVFSQFIEQCGQVQTGADSTDRSGQYIVEHECGDGELCGCASHRLAHHSVDSASNEHAAAFDIDRANCVGEQHDCKDEPRCRLANGLLRDATDVVSGRSKVA